MYKEYRKLVRDGIPEIIRRKGEQCEVAVMAEEEYRQALREKLVEEATEAAQAATLQALITELADVQEVLDTLRATSQCSPLRRMISGIPSRTNLRYSLYM